MVDHILVYGVALLFYTTLTSLEDNRAVHHLKQLSASTRATGARYTKHTFSHGTSTDRATD